MSTEKKEIVTPVTEEQELLKSISALLDETIKEVETLAKGEVSFSDLKLQPDEQGDMPANAGQPSDDAAGLKKEDEEEKKEEEKEEEKKDEPKPFEGEEKKEEVEKAIPEDLNEAKDEPKEEEKKDEKEEDKDEDEDEMPKFERMLGKAMLKMGLIKKSEEEVPAEELQKSEEEEDLLKTELKARDVKIEALTKTIEGLTKQVSDISSRPAPRKAVTGLKAIAKSDSDMGTEPLAKGQVLSKLLDLQKSGDKRVTPVLITKFEQTGDADLVKGLI